MPETTAALFEEFFAFWWREHPTWATAVGEHAHDGELERHDEASRHETARRLRAYREAFERVSPRDAGEWIDRELVLGRVRWKIRELEELRTHERNPLLYLEGPLSALYLMAVREYAPAEERAARARERLAAWPRLLDEARENLRDASPVLAETAVAVARSGLTLLESALPLGLGRALEDDEEEFRRWENTRRGAADALLNFADWLETEIVPRAQGDFAIGREVFEARLRDIHGLTDTADELLRYGERLKAETERSLVEVAKRIDGERSWREIAESLKDDHPSGDSLIETYAAEMERARAFVEEHELVDLPADESLEVTATPEFLRPLVPYAAYLPPAPFETEQKGFFFVTPVPDDAPELLRDHPRHGIPVTALHEGYPGHHLQLVRSNRAGGDARRVFQTPVFAEGWALYCEEMMGEAGFYTDPKTRLLQLKDLHWRACRVVVDVGLHTRGWSVDRAVAYLVDEAGLERANAETEVRRYCADPTQPLSYAVGKREILRLRDLYRERAGTDFRLRDFHDDLLSWGTVPPALIGHAETRRR